jgi:putative transposase
MKCRERALLLSFVIASAGTLRSTTSSSSKSLGWHWFARLKSNRLIDSDDTGNVPVGSIEIPAGGRAVHLKGYGFVKVFKSVSKNGDVEYYATDDLEMMESEREALSDQEWGIEVYHRGIDRVGRRSHPAAPRRT